jgi:hypothetical protein
MKSSINPWKCLIDAPISSDHAKTIFDNPNPQNSSTTKATASPTIIPLKPTNNTGNLENTTTEPTNTNHKQTKTFAQAVSSLCDIPSSQLPQAVLKGDNYAISIPEEEYLVGLETCKYNLQAQIIWPKGSTPLTVVALRTKLSSLWKDLNR